MKSLSSGSYRLRMLLFVVSIFVIFVLGNLFETHIGAAAPGALISTKVVEVLALLGLNAWLIQQRLYLHWLQPHTMVMLLGVLGLQIWFAIAEEIPNRLPAAIVIGLAGAIPEEIMVRGIMLGSFLDHWRGRWVRTRAVIWSSLLFALLHLMNLSIQSVAATLSQIIGAFAMGCLLAALYLRAGNLLAPLAAHFLWDFFATLVSGNANPFSVVGSYQRGEWVGDLIQFGLQLLIALLLVTVGPKPRRDRLTPQLRH